MLIHDGKAIGQANEIAGELLDLLGSQQRVAAVMGVAQPTVSRWINHDGTDLTDSARVLAARIFAAAAWRLRWVESWLGCASLVRKVEALQGGQRKLLDRRIIEVDELTASRIVVESLPDEWAASGDYIGHYRMTVDGLRLVSYTHNTEARPRPVIANDPIFGG